MNFYRTISFTIPILLQAILISCKDLQHKIEQPLPAQGTGAKSVAVIKPLYVTDTVPSDTDDPAIWINQQDPGKSLVIGTDKNERGGLYVFDLKGKMDTTRSVRGLNRPNNVDIEYGFKLGGGMIDIAVATERYTHKLRIYSLPGMQPVDDGGIPVFVGETQPGYRELMGIALYKNRHGQIYAIVGRKTGPTDGSYLWQYLLEDDGKGHIKATLMRKFGKYSGKHEIESIAVDDELGYVYYSDEGTGVRKYYAGTGNGNSELALFADSGFAGDHEGISIYKTSDSTGFILVSDQQANRFHIFRREGDPLEPHRHKLLRVVKVSANESDGSETVSIGLNKDFPKGIFVAMSDNKTFHFYRAETILGDSLLTKK